MAVILPKTLLMWCTNFGGAYHWMYDSRDDAEDIYRKPFNEKLEKVENYLKPMLKL